MAQFNHSPPKNIIRLGLSQRVDMASGQDWLATEEWAPFLTSMGDALGVTYEWFPLANNPTTIVATAENLELNGIILTGGNTISDCPWRDNSEQHLLAWATSHHKPLLGVCRGAQLLGVHAGGHTEPLHGHAGTRHKLNYLPGWPFKVPDVREVNSFHDYGLTKLPSSLTPLAVDSQGWLEAFRHRDLPQFGILWHPERDATLHPADVALFRYLFGANGLNL